jgi:hypothetical protein
VKEEVKEVKEQGRWTSETKEKDKKAKAVENQVLQRTERDASYV